MGPLGSMVSICTAPANGRMDGRQKLAYVMSFADRQVSKAKNAFLLHVFCTNMYAETFNLAALHVGSCFRNGFYVDK